MSAAVLPETCRIAVQTGLVLLLQTGLILLLGLGVGWALRRRGPQAQCLAYRATLLAVLCVAVLSPSLVHGRRALWRVSLPARAPVPSASPGVGEAAPTPEPRPVPVHALPLPPASATGDVGPVDAPPVALGTPHVHAAGVHTTLDVLPWAAGLWGAGTLALLAWLGLGQASLMVLRRRSVPAGREATDLLAHLCAGRGLAAPRLLVSSRVGSPFLAGLWRPAIFLPASYAQDFDADALRAILAHELGHWERRDNAWALLARLTCAVFWPQPLLWALCRRMAQAAEEACDALALAQGCSPRAYADCLLSLAERLAPTCLERSMGTSVVPFRSHVGRRVQQVLQARRLPVLPGRLRVVIAAGALCAVIAGPLLVSAADTSREKAHAASPRTAPSGAIIGRITYENGQPASGVEVWTTMQARSAGTYGAAGHLDIVGKRISVVSGTDGSFRMTGLQKGHYVVMDREKSGHWVAAARENVAVLPGEVTHVPALVLTPGAILSGTVTEKPTGRPVPGVSVMALGPRYPASMLGASGAETDTQGHYSLRLAPGDNWIYVSGNGYECSNIGIDPVNNSNPKYPGYARGFHVTLRQGQMRTVPILAVRAAPSPTSPANGPMPVSRAGEDQAQFLAGLTPVQGPGLIVTLRDSKMPFLHSPKGSLSIPGAPNLIHDTDINQTVNELKAAGAEAIAVNNQRLVGMSPIRSAGPTVYVNTTPQAPPFVIKAIGDPETLQTALNLPNGVADGLRRMDPAMISMQQSASLTLPAYSRVAQPKYAHPLGQAITHAGTKPTLAAKMDALVQQRGADNVAREAAKLRLNELNRKIRLLKPGSAPTLPPGIRQKNGVDIVDRPDAPVQQKKEYIRKVHTYNQQWVQYWNAVAKSQDAIALVQALSVQIQMLDTQIASLRSQTGYRLH